jgi:hypothetical protein
MTNAGKALESANLSWDKAAPLWEEASRQFARNSTQTAHAFLNNPLVTGIWSRIELPELTRRGVDIVVHGVVP